METYVIMPNEDLCGWFEYESIKNICGALMISKKANAIKAIKYYTKQIARELPQFKGCHLDLLFSSNGTWGETEFVSSFQI